MQTSKIACQQITWYGRDRTWTEEEILGEIAQAGYAGASAGPRSDRSAPATLELYRRFGLQPAPGYLSGAFWDPEAASMLLKRAHEFGAFSKAIGLSELYVAAGGFDHYQTRRGKTRNQIAGRVEPDDRMTDAEFEQFARTLNRVGAVTLEYGVRSCFHNHVGSTIETRAEIDRLMSLVDREVIFLGPDTGHLAWAGADVTQFFRDYAGSILTVHLKDISPQVLAQGAAAEWDYRNFTQAGIWTELGGGAIDFPTLLAILDQAGYDGWTIVETDVTQLATPLESAIVDRQYLKSIGL